MKGVLKLKKIIPYIIPIAMAFTASLWLSCVLNYIALAMSPFGSFGQFPRFIPFCIVVGVLSFLFGIFLIWLFYKAFVKMESVKEKRAYVFIGGTVFLVCFFIFPYLIDNIFSWLQATF